MIVTVTYTTLGGLKAVIWTDAIQMVIFCLPLIIIAVLGTAAVGGWHAVWEEAGKGGRLEFFNMTLNPLERTSFLAAVVGGFFHWTGYNAVNQTCVQRYLSVPTLKAARTTAYIFMVGVIGIITFCTYIGLVMFVYFKECDPLQANLVATSDQIVPLFVMRIEEGLHGLPGLFMAGVLSAALSSISVALNSSAGVVLDDLWRPFAKKEMTEFQGAVFAKIACVALGVLCTGMTMAMSGLQYMIQVAMTLMGIAAGTQFGITSLGMFNPWANWKGALTGGIASLIIMGWISVGNELMSIQGRLNYPTLPVKVSGCDPPLQATPSPTMDPTILPIYRLSFLYVALFGWMIVMVVGSIVSLLTGPCDPDKADPDAHTPLVGAWLRRRQANKKASVSMERLDRMSVGTISLNLKQA
ncbi:sodium-coupled monocarboxylate transporter 2-like [Frankliniella occidentalis]|uniref:Sodium-coupled monocarboxylate transporter 2-like n=1 Tax=Frankliniella occidentalis TaxID=133901 RepID=A0A9C6XCV0_FRAOC|nr:sodium-coupled monocarboxylate transporter 2-like [Frankliniella occidentalis]